MAKPRFKWLKDAGSGGQAQLRFSILIVGGGFSGAMVAYQLLRRDPDLDLAIVDSGETLGHGLAYSATSLSQVLNVPAENMSALPEEADASHFLKWARRNYDSEVLEGSFLPRVIYGRYLDSLLKEAATRSQRNLPWLRDQVLTLTRVNGLFRAQLKTGRKVLAKTVVIATGNVPPGDPSVPGLTDSATKYFPFSWSQTALEGLRGDVGVLLIGAGLTSVDLAIGLASKGFQGTIHMLSRRGCLPQAHRQGQIWPPFWNKESPKTVRGMLRLIRSQVRAAAEAGVDWRSVIDALRPVTPEIWRSLPENERRRFMRHARPYWEAHRHRVAPEVGAQLSHLIGEGRVQVHAGRIKHYHEEGNLAVVRYRQRRDGQSKVLRVGRVINCTGPEADWRRIDNSLLSSLFAQRLARPDLLFLGLDVDQDGSVLDDRGVASKSLFAIGPVRKGSLWETTAVPELRRQASRLAEHIIRVRNEECSVKARRATPLSQ